MANSIDGFTFLSLAGEIDRPGQTVELVNRPGVAGNAAWLTGRRGAPFQLVAAVDCVDLSTAHAALAAYKALVGADPVAIVKNDYAYALETPALTFLILDVRATDGTPCELGAAGNGLNPPSAAWLVTAWTLVAVEAT